MDKNEANKKLEEAGAYGRTVDRWWAGFYHSGLIPTVEYTLGLTVMEIFTTIVCSSRRG